MKKALGLMLCSSLLLASCGQNTAANTATDRVTVAPGIQRDSTGKVYVNAREAATGPTITISKIGEMSISPIKAQALPGSSYLSTAPEVEVTFSDGTTVDYANINNVAVYDQDVAFSMSDDVPNRVSAYEASVSVFDPINTGSGLSGQSSIGKRGFICTVHFFFCWAGYTNTPAWPGKKVYYNINSSAFTADELNTIKGAIAEWNRLTGDTPRWVPASESPYSTATTITKFWPVVSSITPHTAGMAPVGYTQQRILPRLFLSSNGANDKGTILHEMGHVAGLNHEHQRCDRDQYLNILAGQWERIYNFANWNKLCAMGEDIGKFDYDSLMLYHNGTAPKYARIAQSGENFTGTWQTGNWYNPDNGVTRDVIWSQSPYTLSAGDKAGLRTLYP